MTNLAISVGIVILLELLAFILLYRFTKWSGKQVAFTVIVVALGMYIPLGIVTWKSLDRFAIHFAFYVMIPYVLGIITTHWEVRRTEEGEQANKKWFHWAPATLVVFFLLLALVDATIITIAEKGVSEEFMQRFFPKSKTAGTGKSKFSGTVPHDFQEKEKLFNAYLEKRKQQQARGWQVRKGWIGKPVAGKQQTFKVAVTDREGKPVSRAKIHGQFLRPADNKKDIDFEMQEVDNGIYQTKVLLSEPGLWSLTMTIERGDEWHEVRAKTTIQAAQ
ncbi:MAG TPA: nitrogen fixation protein FixH [Chromatiales bacterium]|nr:nitrogen fixation protein FixH [Chromatiales bacterium]